MDVDADVLIDSRTKRFFGFLARRQNALPVNAILEFGTGNVTATRFVGTAVIFS